MYLAVKFRRQHPVYNFIVDFYCHEYKLVIEVDGDIHNDEIAYQYDLGRTKVLNNFGLKVIRFTNDQILYSLDSVIEEIQREVANRTPLRGAGGQKRDEHNKIGQGGKKEMSIIELGRGRDEHNKIGQEGKKRWH